MRIVQIFCILLNVFISPLHYFDFGVNLIFDSLYLPTFHSLNEFDFDVKIDFSNIGIIILSQLPKLTSKSNPFKKRQTNSDDYNTGITSMRIMHTFSFLNVLISQLSGFDFGVNFNI